ncbi:uncharacterized protein MKZ38_004713 [Zalerion maritima]|uniref:C2H2-type domain-containing protein n=1 Tax=Zalerion maritima TaxID=339359 RepID=A0AAD5WPD8_9PEZI|nr:uncharacterized protein MKZ38_004713 [Zalerion maritima]
MSAPASSQVQDAGVQTSIPATGNSSSSSATPAPPSSAGGASTGTAGTTNASTTSTNNATASTQAGSSSPPQEDLVCRWNGCSDRFNTAETLYEHICERHVGRKSTNNLNLTCQWNSCRTTTVKRDHITSHIRVHVPLKPHKCDFCGKSFKRPQDLKKHVKTHADDSVLVVPQSDRMGNSRGGMPVPTSSYYDPGAMRTNQTLGQPHQNGQANNYHYPTQAAAYSTAPMYGYAPSNRADMFTAGPAGTTAASTFDTRKRSYEAVSDLFQSIKRREIDPNSYSQVDRSLVPLHNSLPVHTGSVGNHYMATASAVSQPAISAGPVGSGHGGVATAAPANPLSQRYYLPNSGDIRTKNDLLQVDRFLEQMQGTIYESDPATTPATTLAQSGSHYAPAHVHIRNSHSPPQMHTQPQSMPPGSYAPQVSAAHMASPLSAISSAHSTGTPAVTPPSSSMSYTSGHSPGASSAGFSPGSRHSSTASVMYPALSMAPSGSNITPTLGTSFDTDRSRRHSGGLLQKASRGLAPLPEISVDVQTPKEKESESAVSSPSASESSTDARHEAWLENIRLIEYLRQSIQNKLSVGDFDQEEEDKTEDAPKEPKDFQMSGDSPRRSATPAESDPEPLYPLLKPLAL